jgi:predicted enzyme related to lactoylglutathione lyase
MKTIPFLLLILSFCLGFLSKYLFDKLTKNPQSENPTNSVPARSGVKVTGIGGIFFKSKDPKALKDWYKTHLGLQTDDYGTNFEWRQATDPTKTGSTQWSPFKEKTTYFMPSSKDFMINYRVENIETLVHQLKNEGVTILDEMETFDYGKFIHILDNEGNKIELWEPIDTEYDKIKVGVTK